MRIYEFIAPYFEIGFVERFLGFANNDTRQYLWMQRGEDSAGEVEPYAGNVWIERDDQRWGGPGGVRCVTLSRDILSIQLTPDRAEDMGGYDVLRAHLSLSDEEFRQARMQLLRVFAGYDEMMNILA